MSAGRRCSAAVLAAWTFLAVCGAAIAGGPIARDVLARPGGYTSMWWARGVRDERLVFRVQTGRYAMSFDYARFRLTHLMPLTSPVSEEAVLTQDEAAVFARANAAMECVIEADGAEYRAVAPPRANYHNCHLIESGRLFQRRYLEKLTWAEKKGTGVFFEKDSRPLFGGGLEIAAWPDRLMLLLRVAPKRAVRRGAIRMTLSVQSGGLVLFPAEADRVRQSRQGASRTFRLAVGDWPAGAEKELAVVVYPAGGEPEAAAEEATARQRRPLKVTARQIAPTAVELATSYDARLGWHRVALRNDVPARSPEARNRRIERVALRIENNGAAPRPVRLCFEKRHPFAVTGISAMLRSAAGEPTGIPVQLSKNWHSKRSDGRYQGAWFRGLAMLTVPAKTALELEYTSVNALWGGVPAASEAQLCLVGWGSNQLWRQAAIGAWGESICFEPDQGQRGGAVLDTRPLMVWSMGGRPKRKWGWTHNVGGADFLVYYDRGGRKQWSVRMRTLPRRSGPVLTETAYAGRSADGRIDLRYAVSLYRTDDVTRGLYRFRYDVRRATAFSRLVLFQCGGDHYSYTGERTFARGNEGGLIDQWATKWGGNVYRTKPAEVTGRVPWLSMHNAVPRQKDRGAWANRGFVIRGWKARLGGRPARPWAAERGAKVRGADTSLIDILPPPDVEKLLPGDFVEAAVEHVVVPQRAEDYYGPNENLRAALKAGADTWRMIAREARGNDLAVAVTLGRLIRARPTAIAADADRAAFSIAGGLGYVPITIAGLTSCRRPTLKLREAGGDWRTVDQSDHGGDFWQMDYDEAKATWEVTFSVPLDTPGDARRRRDFRFDGGGGSG